MRKIFVCLFLLVFALNCFSFTTVILVDTSRSVPKEQFAAAKSKIASLSSDLVRNGSVTVVSFNDEPQFEGKNLTDAGLVRSKIEAIEQGGKFTLLYDALVKALQHIEDSKEKGIILLVSDGKDENSATVIEDAARKAESLQVPVLTIGIGSEDKSLRRLPLLTKGEYLGNIGAFSPNEVYSFVEKVKAKEVEEKAKEEAAKPKEVLPPPPPPAKEESGGAFVYFLWIALILLATAVAVLVIYFVIKNKKQEERVCENCGKPLAIWETECPNCFLKKLSDTKPGVTVPEIKSEPQIDIDPELFKKNPTSEDLDSTMVIEEIPVLLQLRGNQPPKMFQVSKDNPITIGRDKINNISIDDKTLSAQHFRIVPKDGQWFVLDLNSTNGTFVDGERIRYREIKHGSQIHAGQNQFIFRIEQKRLS